MALFTLPPTPPRADLELENFLRGKKMEHPIGRYKRMLAPEWFPQSGVQLTWPHADTDWAYMLPEITALYQRLAYEIATRELLLIVAPDTESVRRHLEEQLPKRATDNIIYIDCPTNDTWARDHAFLSVLDTGKPELLDFGFNGWGGKFEAAADNAINRGVYASGRLEGSYIDCLDFILEGGSIESDGCGTILTTKACLLNPNRNPGLNQAQITLKLQDYFGAPNVLWLSHGALIGDDTDSHIDTLARLCPGNKLVYVQCTDESDPQYADLCAMEAELKTFKNADGEPFELIPLPLPDICEADGERLPATYANYLVLNKAVLFPTYGQPAKDDLAQKALHQAFPKYDLVGIDCRPLIRQHGSLHCATMQFPKGILHL